MSEHPSADPGTPRRVSNFELLFDLVFVFAFTQVTGVMINGHAADPHAAIPVLQALTVLALLWGVWTSFGWFSNQVKSDGGLLRVGLALAMVPVFVLALAIPTAFHRPGADVTSAVVLVCCYALARLLHIALIFRAAAGDPPQRRQVILTNVTSLPITLALLGVGAGLGGVAQAWIWFGAAVIDAALIRVTSTGGSWRIHSPSHWAERFNLVVMLALGESVVSIGVGVAAEPLVWQVIIGAVLSIVGAVVLWWLYFHKVSGGAEHALASRSRSAQVEAATIGYTYLHYLIVAGIILTATGIEQTMHQIASSAPLGWFGGAALAGGVSLYQAGTVFFWRKMTGEWLRLRLIVATALLPGIVIAAFVTPMAALALAVVLGILLNVVEARPAAIRATRGSPEPARAPSPRRR